MTIKTPILETRQGYIYLDGKRLVRTERGQWVDVELWTEWREVLEEKWEVEDEYGSDEDE
jgi:hypothetical protein